MRYILFCAVLLSAGCASSSAVRDQGAPGRPRGGWTPLQLSLCNPVQVFPDTWDVYGVDANLLYGRNRDVYGLKVGPFWSRARHVAGVQVTVGSIAGTQAADVAEADRMEGIQVGALMSSAGEMTGLQVGGLGAGADDMDGVQVAGLFTMSEGMHRGAQIAGLNMARAMRGAQIGALYNFRQRGPGVQIGLINVNVEGLIPFFPIINFSN